MKKITPAEKVILKILWDSETDMQLREIVAIANEKYNRGWKNQTVTTYLSHLVTKGYIELYRSDAYRYRVIIDEIEYKTEYINSEVQFWNDGDKKAYISDILWILELKDLDIKELLSQ